MGLISSVFLKTDKSKRIAIFYLFNDVVQHAHLKLQENGEMKHFLEHVKSTLKTSGEDVKTTLETSWEDVKLHSKRVEKMWNYTRNERRRCVNTLETSGEDV